jgi:protein-S-isoprenylcysteine O-methyltransferase Ste14
MYSINNKPISSYILVGLQLFALGALTYFGPMPAHTILGIASQLIGLILAFWAVYEMRKSRLSVLPDLQAGARLVTSGPYKILRHPMYTSLLLLYIPLTLEMPSLNKFLFFGLLTIALFGKTTYEEKLLAKNFPEFENYKKSSYIMLPFIW